jgi:hypothetical protein
VSGTPASTVAERIARWRTLLVLILIMGGLFFGSILFILSRAPK